LRLWDFLLKSRLSNLQLNPKLVAELPEQIYMYMFFKNGPQLSRSDLSKCIASLQKLLPKIIEEKEKLLPAPQPGKAIVAELDNLPRTDVVVDSPDMDKLLKKLETACKGILCPFIMATSDLGLPLAYRDIAKAVQAAVSKLKKSKEFLFKYVNNLQRTIRQEEAAVLTARITNCELTKSIFDLAKIPLCRESFLKIMITLAKVFDFPYVIPENLVCNTAQLTPGLFWETQKDPTSHQSLIAAHLSSWASTLQMNRVTKFEVSIVRTDFVN
jgi:hypothetical protein